jgi:hypothetical protein
MSASATEFCVEPARPGRAAGQQQLACRMRVAVAAAVFSVMPPAVAKPEVH